MKAGKRLLMSYPGSESSGDHGRHDLDFNFHPVDPAVIAPSRGAIKKLQNTLFYKERTWKTKRL